MNTLQRTELEWDERLAPESCGSRGELVRTEGHTCSSGRYLIRVYHRGRRVSCEVLRATTQGLELLAEDHVPACVAVRARQLQLRGGYGAGYIGSGDY